MTSNTSNVEPEGPRWLRRQMVSSVAAVAVKADGGFRATSVSAFFVASLDPPQMLVSVEAHGQMADWIADSGTFALSILSRSDQFLADRFAGFAPLVTSDWSDVAHHVARTGSPILSRAIAWADCTVADTFDTGDHRCIVGDIVELGSGSGDPDQVLLYFQGGYRRLAE